MGAAPGKPKLLVNAKGAARARVPRFAVAQDPTRLARGADRYREGSGEPRLPSSIRRLPSDGNARHLRQRAARGTGGNRCRLARYLRNYGRDTDRRQKHLQDSTMGLFSKDIETMDDLF